MKVEREPVKIPVFRGRCERDGCQGYSPRCGECTCNPVRGPEGAERIEQVLNVAKVEAVLAERRGLETPPEK